MHLLTVNLASLSTLFAIAAALGVTLTASLLGRTPGWHDFRRLTLVAGTAALASACDLPSTLPLSASVHVWAARLQLIVLALHITAWHYYVSAWSRRPLSPRAWQILIALFTASAAALIPDLAFGEAVRVRAFPALGLVYFEAVPSTTGELLYGLTAVSTGWLVLRIALHARAGLPRSRTLLVCTSCMLLIGLHDLLVSSSSFSWSPPYLLELALCGPLFPLVGFGLQRVIDNARDLYQLKSALEATVATQSKALTRAHDELVKTERLAALGLFTGGVAHELNGPAAALSANLGYLESELGEDRRSDVRSCIEDSREALARIVDLARQLLVASRTAERPAAITAPVSVANAIQAALQATRGKSRPIFEPDVRIVPEDLAVPAHEEALRLVLSNLLAHIAPTFPPLRRGHITIRADKLPGQVRIAIEDEQRDTTTGQSQLPLFEPLRDAHPSPELAVSHGLVAAMGGTLRSEAAAGVGVRVTLVLPDPTTAPPSGRPSILLVDADPDHPSRTAERLGEDYRVVIAREAGEAWTAIERQPFDLVLCDLAIPPTGGEGFWDALLLRAPQLADHVIFLLDSASPPETRAFLARQKHVAIERPVDLEKLQTARDLLRRGASAYPPSAAATTSIDP